MPASIEDQPENQGGYDLGVFDTWSGRNIRDLVAAKNRKSTGGGPDGFRRRLRSCSTEEIQVSGIS